MSEARTAWVFSGLVLTLALAAGRLIRFLGMSGVGANLVYGSTPVLATLAMILLVARDRPTAAGHQEPGIKNKAGGAWVYTTRCPAVADLVRPEPAHRAATVHRHDRRCQLHFRRAANRHRAASGQQRSVPPFTTASGPPWPASPSPPRRCLSRNTWRATTACSSCWPPWRPRSGCVDGCAKAVCGHRIRYPAGLRPVARFPPRGRADRAGRHRPASGSGPWRAERRSARLGRPVFRLFSGGAESLDFTEVDQ